MDLLPDTQTIVWIVSGDPRLSPAVSRALSAPDTFLFVSAATAFEFTDLELRCRFPPIVSFAAACEALDLQLLDDGAAARTFAERLPALHRDPVDRMLIAHALHAGLTLATADATMRDYPVQTLW